MLKKSKDSGMMPFIVQHTEEHLHRLIERIPWKRVRKTKRMVCSLGKSYPYSGQITVGEPFSYYPPIEKLMQRINAELGTNFNSVLLNWYPKDTWSGIGRHCDDEKELVPNTPVVSVSLGASTLFVLAAKDGSESVPVTLNDGDVFIMGKECQKYYTHECPYIRMPSDRISLTFREFK